MLWVRFLAAMLAVAMLAGCASDDSGADDADTDPLPDADDGGGSGDDEPADEPADEPPTEGENTTQNRAPEIEFTASAQNGTQPLTVDFTLEASDADGDALSWSFDADGDGTPEHEGQALPASFNHTYQTSEDHTATARVSDGEETVAASLLISVVERTITPVQETWALAWPDCDTGRFMSMDAASEFGCAYTFHTANVVVSEDGALEHDFPADAATGGFPAGSPVHMEIDVGIVGPYAGSLSARLIADGDVVGQANVTDVGPDVAPVEVRTFTADFTIDEDIAEGAMLTFVFHMETAGYMEFQSGSVDIG